MNCDKCYTVLRENSLHHHCDHSKEIERLREALTIAQYDGTKLQMITRALGAEPVDLQEGQSGWSPEFHGVMVLRAELKKRDDLARLVRTYKVRYLLSEEQAAKRQEGR